MSALPTEFGSGSPDAVTGFPIPDGSPFLANVGPDGFGDLGDESLHIMKILNVSLKDHGLRFPIFPLLMQMGKNGGFSGTRGTLQDTGRTFQAGFGLCVLYGTFTGTFNVLNLVLTANEERGVLSVLRLDEFPEPIKILRRRSAL